MVTTQQKRTTYTVLYVGCFVATLICLVLYLSLYQYDIARYIIKPIPACLFFVLAGLSALFDKEESLLLIKKNWLLVCSFGFYAIGDLLMEFAISITHTLFYCGIIVFSIGNGCLLCCLCISWHPIDGYTHIEYVGALCSIPYVIMFVICIITVFSVLQTAILGLFAALYGLLLLLLCWRSLTRLWTRTLLFCAIKGGWRMALVCVGVHLFSLCDLLIILIGYYYTTSTSWVMILYWIALSLLALEILPLTFDNTFVQLSN